MRASTLVLGLAVCLMASTAMADTYFTGASSSDWATAGNWDIGVPDSGLAAKIGYSAADSNDVRTPVAQTVAISGTADCATVHVNGGSTLTVNGNLTNYATDGWPGIGLGTSSGMGTGTMIVESGIVTGKTVGGHGPGMFVGRHENGYVYQSGGTVRLQETTNSGMALGGMSGAGTGYYEISGGTLDSFAMYLPHRSNTAGGTFVAKDDAVVNLSGTLYSHYSEGLRINGGGLMKIEGGDVDIAVSILRYGWFDDANRAAIEWAGDATGISCIKAPTPLGMTFGASTASDAVIKCTSDGNLQPGTHWLVSNITGWNFDGSGASMYFSSFMDLELGAGFSNLRLIGYDNVGNDAVDDAWDIVVDYVPEPATLALLSLGGLLAIRRRR